ncbi:MAG: hypothetical protein ACK58H_11140 [Planctomyces sp.]
MQPASTLSTSRPSRRILVAVLLVAGLLPCSPALAQNSSPKTSRPKRSLVLEVLIQPSPIYRVRAQEWGRELQELGYAPRFREPAAGEKMRIEQQLKDGRDVLLVVGGLTKEGALTLGTKTYAVADMKELGRFLDDLRTHGPGGAPAGNPRWGLSEEQFQNFVKLVSEPVEGEVALGSAAAAVSSLKLPDSLTVVFADAAFQASLQPRPTSAPESLNLGGLTKGTALALVLAQYGMGFRPVPGRGDRYSVEIVVGDEGSNLWPAGWKTAESTADVVPAWLKSIPFDVEDADVASIAQAVADKLELPLIVSSQSIQRDGKPLEDLVYSRSGKLSPFGILRGLADKFELGFDVRADEAGKLFLWATSSRDAAAFNKRFAHIRPPK